MADLSHIRNFSIIAHIDHGKSTIADRFHPALRGAERPRDVRSGAGLHGPGARARHHHQGPERHPGLQGADGETYRLNFIDTPGHVDFSYEVSRSLAACEGALLVVDAAQGVEAQSVANCYTAIEQGLEVLPVLNKIDLPSAEPERVINQIEEIIGLEAQDALQVSAKTGEGIPDLLEALVASVPPPVGDPEAPLQALIIDSWFDPYVASCPWSGWSTAHQAPRQGDDDVHRAQPLGGQHRRVHAQEDRAPDLGTGEVGFLVAGIKEIDGAPVGDTVTLADRPAGGPCRVSRRCSRGSSPGSIHGVR